MSLLDAIEFHILGQDASATPETLTLGNITKPWDDWTSEILKARLFAMGGAPKDLEIYLRQIATIKRILQKESSVS